MQCARLPQVSFHFAGAADGGPKKTTTNDSCAGFAGLQSESRSADGANPRLQK
jgi:hypothetical protein